MAVVLRSPLVQKGSAQTRTAAAHPIFVPLSERQTGGLSEVQAKAQKLTHGEKEDGGTEKCITTIVTIRATAVSALTTRGSTNLRVHVRLFVLR